VVPQYNEVRDEFEISVTDDMIFQVHMDKKFSSRISKDCNHVNEVIMHWASRNNIGLD
jgi:hypothetical protein